MKIKIRFANNDDNIAVRKLWDDCFDEDSIAWRDWYFSYIYSPKNTILLDVKGEIISMTHINPYPMMLNKKSINACALSGVSTREKDRKHGYPSMLIEHSLREMHKRKIAFSFLYPFKYDFYRKFGYEVCYSKNNYRVTPEDVPIYKIEKTDSANVAVSLYEDFCKNLNGHIIRDDRYLKMKFDEQFADNNSIYLIKDGAVNVGYCMTKHYKTLQNDHKNTQNAYKNNTKTHKMTLISEELICNSPHEAAKSISSILRLPIEYETPIGDENLEYKITPHCMGRVIDVISVFDDIESKKNSLVIKIEDNIIKENDDIFLFDGTSGRLQVSKTDLPCDVTFSIGEISTMATGYKSNMSKELQEVYERLFLKRHLG